MPERNRRAGVVVAGWLARRLSQGAASGKAKIGKAQIGTAKIGKAKPKTTRKVTKEWRHGNCPVRHQTRRAALRCRNR